MPKSPAFIRIREQVLHVVAVIPEARVSTFQSIGEHLAVMPRHVAYILAQLTPGEKMVSPWHRVVAHDRSLGVPKQNPDGRSQSELLKDEGVLVSANKLAAGFSRLLIPAGELQSGVAKQVRPNDLPKKSRLVAAKPPTG
jgi:methylated-DNA-protein-cysteine methyltransferase related protein